jgi:hypothetical protein
MLFVVPIDLHFPLGLECCQHLGKSAFSVLYDELSMALSNDLVNSAQARFCYCEKKLLHKGKLHEVCPEDIQNIVFARVYKHFQCGIDELSFRVTPAYCTLNVSGFDTQPYCILNISGFDIQQQDMMFQSLEEALEPFRMPYAGSLKYIVYRHHQTLAIEVDFVAFVQNLFKNQVAQLLEVAVVEFSMEEFCIMDNFIRLPVESTEWVAEHYICLEDEYKAVVAMLTPELQ